MNIYWKVKFQSNSISCYLILKAPWFNIDFLICKFAKSEIIFLLLLCHWEGYFYKISDAEIRNVYDNDDLEDDVMAIELSDDHSPILMEGAEVFSEWDTMAYFKLLSMLAS